MCYRIQLDENISKPIEMAASKKWMYQVNGSLDNDPPAIAQESGSDIFEVKLLNSDEELSISQETSHTIFNSPNFDLYETMSFPRPD